MPDWDAVRREFPALERYTFLNSATYGQLPRATTKAVEEHFSRRDQFACSDFLEWFDDADRIRGSIARLIHCEGEDIAFFPNAATAVSLLAQGIGWRAGDRILTLEDEFPNHLYIAQSLARADIVAWPRFLEALTPRTRLVMLSTVNYTTGLCPPLDKIAEACRANGTVLCIDGTQSIGALRFDAARIQPDMFAVDGYKWLCCPNGSGFAYIHPRVREWLKPQTIGWRSDKRWREVNSLHHGAPEFKGSAERYEGGILPFPAIYAMGASVEFMLQLGPEAIEQRVLELAGNLRDRLRGLGAQLLSDEDAVYVSPIVAARWPGVDSGNLSLALKQRRILTAARHGNLRVSTHFYNNEGDIDRLIQALRDLFA
ncbi:MAG: aminotransferase class V-fold PLP-dependent enzyme [Bryobacterales bacterium]|nr:aminotransferase class V-fold PLP-dependent enzyme [Bryobacterales bacterium]